MRSKFPSEVAARNFVSLEYHIAKWTIYEELIVFREKGNRFSGIEMDLNDQTLREEDERVFDRLDFRVSCWSDRHWEWLKHDWEQTGQRDGFDLEAHIAKREASKIVYARQFWFDITSVFGSAYQT